jgi:PKHD-type hydroxylase
MAKSSVKTPLEDSTSSTDNMSAPTYNWGMDLVTNERWAYHPVFTPEECKKIIDIGSGGVLATPLVLAKTAKGEELVVREDYRISDVSWICSHLPENAWIFQRLVDVIKKVNDQYFNYDLSLIENVQFTRYRGTQGGFYDKHVDMLYSSTGTRKLSVTIQLSDPDDYTGGELLLHESNQPMRPQRDQGLGIFFPSWMMHEVAPVTKGTRYSLVAWVQGPRFR